MGKLSRDKGKRFEREIVQELAPLFGRLVRRGWQSGGGMYAGDVEGTPFRLECKHQQRPRLFAALEQVERDAAKAGDSRPCLVIARRDREKPVVTMRLADFLEIIQKGETCEPNTTTTTECHCGQTCGPSSPCRQT